MIEQSAIDQQVQLYSNAVYFIETEKIKANPYQPRKEFDQDALRALADSIKMYGVLQPLVVTRHEVTKADGGIATEYELIAGERRLRASRLAGLPQVPAVIRVAEHSDRMKLELAIIENIQREDLNAVDRAMSFKQLAEIFKLTHAEIGKKVGKSREYVSNTLRLLALPQDMLDALSQKKITEGHTRPLLMLADRPEEQRTLFKEIVYRGLNVRDTEHVARRIAHDKARKTISSSDPVIVEIEEKMTETLGTRVHIEKRNVGGKIEIDYFSVEDLQKILDILKTNQTQHGGGVKLGMTTERLEEMNQTMAAVDAAAAAAARRLDPQGMPLPPEKLAEIDALEAQEAAVAIVEQPSVAVDEAVRAEDVVITQEEGMPLEVVEEIAAEYESDKVDFNKPNVLDDTEDLYTVRNFSL